LGENEVSTSIDLFFQVLHFEITFGRWEKLVLREPCHCDVKIVAVVTPYVSYEVDTMHKAAFYRLPFFFSSGRVTSKSENIPATMIFGFLPYREYQ
jgi:hypothetical protein